MELRKFGPKDDYHPSVGVPCPACHMVFKAGDYTTLIPIGPGDDPEARLGMAQNRPYNAISLEVHWDCADPRIFKQGG